MEAGGTRLIINEDEHVIKHYGTPRHSGRYPYGSGGDDATLSSRRSFLDHVDALAKQGLSQPQIAKGMGMSTTELRAKKSIAKNEIRAADAARAQRLRDNGYSNVDIGKMMNRPESSIRALLAEGVAEKANSLNTIADILAKNVEKQQFVDVGLGVEHYMGISKEKLANAVAILKEKGYSVEKVKFDQIGTGHQTEMKVLAPPGFTQKDIWMQRDKIRQLDMVKEYSEDGGRSFTGILPPLSVNSKRVAVRYKEDGGDTADGVIYVRPGKEDISLGKNNYAQVRVAVDGTHYLKGMAIYKSDLPPGVDLMFNTNKSRADIGDNKLDAMKKMKDDPENPFGAVVRQIKKLNSKGDLEVTSAMNLVNEEGDWEKWSKNLSSQMLSKQGHRLAREQLDKAFEKKQEQFDEIMALTNPTVKRKLLETFAEEADSSAVNLKAAAMKGQATHVIIPVNSLKDNEIYAPNYNSGDRVVLIRYPHGGTFEIPELVVNNNHRESKSLLGTAPDAVGINSKVAARLSGADYDGDTVLVIPNNSRKITTSPPLEGLKNFDPQSQYKAYEGMPKMTAQQKASEMGYVSNLITDMTIAGASHEELARAVRHSMVVIDAEKHNLNYKQSHKDNAIGALMLKYQGRKQGGASTLISRATSDKRVPDRKPRPAADGGSIDPKTGKRVFVLTGKQNKDGSLKTVKSTKLAETDDAFTLVSKTKPTIVESVYAEHSNRMKALANEGRKQSLRVGTIPTSPSAKKAYAPQVETLNAKLNAAFRNKPLERQAQLLAATKVAMKRRDHPDMDKAEIKKLKNMALEEARVNMGAEKQKFTITDDEWAAIQAGAISPSRLSDILDNADIDRVKELATPKQKPVMTGAKKRRAEALLASGATQAEVASALGVSLTTLKTTLKEGS